MEIQRLFDLTRYQLEHHPQDRCIVTGVGKDALVHSTQELVNEAEKLSIGLMREGIGPGDMVAISSGNRSEWCLIDQAVLQLGAVLVPIYPTCCDEDFAYVLEHSGAKLCFTGDKAITQKAQRALKTCAKPIKHFAFDPFEGAFNWQELSIEGSAEEKAKLADHMDAVKGSDLATLIYTSGTTGKPKGVMLTHDNILSNVLCSEPRLPVDKNAVAISFLPLSHSFERMIMYLYLRTGVTINFKEDLEGIGDAIREIKPTMFTAVPRLLEKIFDRIMLKGTELSGLKRKLFFWAVDLGLRYEVTGKGPFYAIQLALANKLIFSKWREALGGRVEVIASGSAALQPRLARIFNAARIPIMEGYGLTETSPVVSVNHQKKNGLRFGTVGRTIDRCEVQIAEDGEILVKGPNVMQGYYKEEQKTKEVIDPDGWFHTGDIGEVDQDGFLKITDRKKEIFKTSGGKYIAPQLIENKLKESPFIEQVLVLGENRKFASALIVPNFEYVKEYCKSEGIAYPEQGSVGDHAAIRQKIQEDIDACNATLGNWETIKRFAVLDREWSIEKSELTPTMKLRRKHIITNASEHIDRMYSGT